MNTRHDKILFWGCFIALITTSYAFISRMILCGGQFITDFGLDKVQVGELQGAGVWPFGVSIILFSLFIDRIGYKTAMIFSFGCYVVYTVMAFAAYGVIQGLEGDALLAAQHKGYTLLYWGSIILALGNGTVEAYINPVVATMFSRDKIKWLNILHAGWPGGLVIGGLVTIGLATHADWRLVLGLILVPAVMFFFMLVGITFPRSEREQAGVGYVDMLKELGAFGALVGFGLVFAQLFQVLVPSDWNWPGWAFWIPTAVVVAAFMAITKSFGRGILAFLIIIMMPLATTEIGTDGWISSLMEEPMKAAGHHPGWVLVYTSAIMMVLRFFAGPMVHKLSPLGLLATCATLAILGLTALSKTANAGMLAIFAAATLYGDRQDLFLADDAGSDLRAVSQGRRADAQLDGRHRHAGGGHSRFPLHRVSPGIHSHGQVAVRESGGLPDRDHREAVFAGQLPGRWIRCKPPRSGTRPARRALKAASKAGQFSALGQMAMFPAFMLVCYVALILYFKSKGGYKPVQLERFSKDTSA